jgi:concanavalin A-like lectin/glucanase superfamily protein
MAVITRAAVSLLRAAAMIAPLLACVGCGSAPLDLVTIDPDSVKNQLVAHWAFDEGTGTTVGDSSGNGHDGVLSGGTWVTGRFGGALSLASGNSVAVAGFPQATASWTVSVWARVSAMDLAADAVDLATLISTETVFEGGWQMQLDNRPGYQVLDAAYHTGPGTMDYVVAVCGCIDPDRWIHLTAVWDGVNDKMTLYRDADAVDEKPMPVHIQTGETTLLMGKWSMVGRYFVGQVDDFAIWSRALNAAEIGFLSTSPPGS